MTEAAVAEGVPAGRREGARFRVLAVVDGLRLGGAEKLLVTFARSATAADIALDVVSLAPLGREAAVVQELRHNGVRVASLDASRLLDPGAARRLVRLIRGSGCDVVHAHLEYSAVMAPLAARIARRPVVCSFHHVPGPVDRRARIREELAVRSAAMGDRSVLVSAAQLAAFRARYPKVKNFEVVLNGIELEPFFKASGTSLPLDLRERIGPGPVVTLVAQFRAGKGHLAAVEAWPRVLERVPGAHLLLVGDGVLRERLEERVAALDLSERVTLTGIRGDVPEIVAGSDLVVLPSESEALPTTLIEAAAGGAPVVATDVGGVSEVVVEGRTGLLVAPGDGAAFADAVADLLDDPDRRRRMGDAARSHAQEVFDAAAWVQRLSALYADVLAGRGGRR